MPYESERVRELRLLLLLLLIFVSLNRRHRICELQNRERLLDGEFINKLKMKIEEDLPEEMVVKGVEGSFNSQPNHGREKIEGRDGPPYHPTLPYPFEFFY